MYRKSFSAYHTIVDGYNFNINVEIYYTETIKHCFIFTPNKMVKIRCKRYGDENRYELNKRAREKYKNNLEPERKRRKKYYLNNKDKSYQAYKKWCEKNPEKYRINKLNNYNNRKEWGISPINDWFKGSYFHHLHINNDKSIGIYIPAELHKSIWHSYNNINTMNKINKLAFEWLIIQEKK